VRPAATATVRYRSAVDVPRAAESLYALSPSRFTAERDALAKALAEKGERGADAVRKLRRPVGLAWVLNRLARERPRDMEALVAAGERLRSGQRQALSGRGADAFRAAEDEVRQRARTLRTEAERILAGEGKPPSPAALARLELLLRVTASAPGPTRDALTRGVLAREPEIAPGELAGFAVLPGGRGTPTGDAATRGAKDRRTAARAAPPDERRARAAEREARAEAERIRRERQRAAARARREADAARAAAEREERAAAAAEERARDARRRAIEARGAAERLAARARQAEKDL
jgi:hypothetical protein